MNNQKIEQHSCTDVHYVRDNKPLTGAVCVALNKDIRQRKADIIFMGGEKDTWSVRSTTELMSILIKWKVSFEARKRVFDFVAERLRVLAAEETPEQLTLYLARFVALGTAVERWMGRVNQSKSKRKNEQGGKERLNGTP